MHGFFRRTARLVSRFLARHPALLFRVQQAGLRFAYMVLDVKMASWVIRRPEWLLKHSKPTPTTLEPELPQAGIPDETLARRIVATHGGAVRGEVAGPAAIPGESIWGTYRQEHYGKLRSLVEQGDSAELAKYFSKLFRTTTVNGYTYGSTFDSTPHHWHYLPIAIELSVVTLAECAGLLRAECHEQGEVAYWRSLFSEHELMDSLEAFFGVRIEAPRAGDPRGIMFGGRFLSRETCSHVYSAHRMRSAIEKNLPEQELQVIEIGGGYGGTCYWLHKLLPARISRYTIVDLPEVNLVQAFYLGTVAESALLLYGERRRSQGPTIELLPHFRLSESDARPNVVINQDSMPEMPESEVARYLKWISEHLDGLFFSFNQETFSPVAGIPQVFVPAVVSRFPRLKRLSRETSWDRRGYVEETYVTR